MSAASETEICNLALTRVGHKTIASMDEGTKGSELCRLHYPLARDSLLRAHPWNFAIRRAVLAQDSSTPLFEFDYKFVLPVDCLKVIRTSWEADGFSNIPYRIQQRYLQCNETDVSIEYIYRIEDVSQFDDLFTDLLAQRLAAEIAMALTDTQTVAKALWEIYASKLNEARLVDAQEGTPRDVVDLSGWLTARA